LADRDRAGRSRVTKAPQEMEVRFATAEVTVTVPSILKGGSA
jgi:hypothetical protein